MPIDTTTAARRTLRFSSPSDVLEELASLERLQRGGRLLASGNWDAGANFRHLAIPIQRSMDGFDGSAVPAWRRIVGRLLLRPIVLRAAAFKPGIRLDRTTEEFLWRPTGFDEGVSMLRIQLNRWIDGVPMTHPHPAFGRMTNEQWATFHLKHCALHLGFLLPKP